MKYYAVIDTNVLVSALLSEFSTPGQVLVEAFVGCIIPLYSDDILAEYNAVLRRPKFKFAEDVVEIAIEEIIKRGINVDAEPIEDFKPDPNDMIFMR